MREADVQKEILDYLKNRGHYVIKTIVSNKKGVPDILGCTSDGKMLAIEVKAPGKKREVTALQVYALGEIKKRGGIAFVADSLEDILEKSL